MAYKTISSDYSNTTWLVLIQKDGVKQVLDTSFKQLGTFSPTTNWEKVFAAGDKINKELKLSEKDVVTIKDEGPKIEGTLALLNLANLAEKKQWKGPKDLAINHDKYFIEAWEEETVSKKRNGK